MRINISRHLPIEFIDRLCTQFPFNFTVNECLFLLKKCQPMDGKTKENETKQNKTSKKTQQLADQNWLWRNCSCYFKYAVGTNIRKISTILALVMLFSIFFSPNTYVNVYSCWSIDFVFYCFVGFTLFV